MLKIVGQSPCGQTVLEFGDYVPFKFLCSDMDTSPHLYWRTGDFDSTLLEIEIDRGSGQVLGGSLILPGSVSKDFPTLTHPDESSSGSPVVLTDNWRDDRYLDDLSPFQVFIDSSRLLILLSGSEAAKTIVSGNVVFGVSSSNSLVWMLITSLIGEQLIKLGS